MSLSPSVFFKCHPSLMSLFSCTQLFLWVWLVSQQGINLCNRLRGHLGQNLRRREGKNNISLKYCSGCWRIAGISFNWGWDRSISKNVPEVHPGSQAAGQWWKHPGGLSWPPHCADTRLQDRENNHWEPGAKTHSMFCKYRYRNHIKWIRIRRAACNNKDSKKEN